MTNRQVKQFVFQKLVESAAWWGKIDSDVDFRINFRIASSPIVSRTRKLKARWTIARRTRKKRSPHGS